MQENNVQRIFPVDAAEAELVRTAAE